MAYATISDLEARWRDLTADEGAIASTLLDDAALYLDTLIPEDEREPKSEILKIVSCNMVKRMMANGAGDLFGVTQGTISADIYSQTLTYSNPTGDMYLTKSERRMLGINKTFIGSIRAKVAGYYGAN